MTTPRFFLNALLTYLPTQRVSLFVVFASLALISQSAQGATDIDISAHYNGPWNAAQPAGSGSGPRFNGAEIAAAPTGGNTGTGITFAKYAGMYVEVGPDISIASTELDFTGVTLPTNPSVNALFNTFYGVSGQVNADIIFTNSAGQTATYTLVGNQTIRDYHNNVYTNDLQGYNLNAAYNNVFTQAWWTNYADANGNGHERLDVTTFILPASWAGTALTSMTISNPTPLSSGNTDDVALSALQVANALNFSPFFNGQVALGSGVYYLAFPANGNIFGYYEFLTDPHYIYHFDLGFEYVFDAADGNGGVYLYDFTSSDYFYTSPTFPFPYLYDFNLQAFLYYYPDPTNPQRYNTNGVRYFYNFSTGTVISK